LDVVMDSLVLSGAAALPSDLPDRLVDDVAAVGGGDGALGADPARLASTS